MATIVSSTTVNIIPEENRATPWFDDGNCIIMCSTVAFKIYKGLLAQHSPVFREMLQRKPAEVIDGCPAIQMDDSAADLASFLNAIHGCERSFQITCKQEFLTLVGVLRIATKYKADGLRQRALHPLQRIYPKSLAQWDDIYEGNSMIWHLDPVLVTNLARELEALSILPAAMAFLANSTLAQEAFGASVVQTHPLRFAPGLLNPEDIKAFTLMKEYNHVSIAKTLRFIREQSKVSCQRLHTGDGCASKFTLLFVTLSTVVATADAPAGYPSFSHHRAGHVATRRVVWKLQGSI
ncbi:hypothetical protein FB45DRAFT_285843 [Roridomyces roridus]|uniref:BTB domain-containing protein n=1 Tax=Roridomyces roridus TaxID=1738132 RepID=A0AAD7CBF2_9AGAR|nr:hypothetical protein FB45DRAFT_285843 [Roridomyces roridus]